jgi:hypothetical protein
MIMSTEASGLVRPSDARFGGVGISATSRSHKIELHKVTEIGNMANVLLPEVVVPVTWSCRADSSNQRRSTRAGIAR